jgi:hypothetical protein
MTVRSWPALAGESPAAFAEDKPKSDKPKNNNPSAATTGIKNRFVSIVNTSRGNVQAAAEPRLRDATAYSRFNCITDTLK